MIAYHYQPDRNSPDKYRDIILSQIRNKAKIKAVEYASSMKKITFIACWKEPLSLIVSIIVF